MEDQPVTVNAAALRSFMTEFFVALALSRADATQAADTLVRADLRGFTSHGVSNMPRKYRLWISSGHVNPTPEWRIVERRAATASIDGDAGLGVALGPRAMRLAIEKAKIAGVGVVNMTNSRHLGMAGYHALLAAEQGLIGVCVSAGGPWMVPTFGREPRLGTNPIAVASPSGSEETFVFDASTTPFALNKIAEARRSGSRLPAGLLPRPDGTPLMEPSDVLEASGEVLLPLGSTPELGSHKGYGLACVVEVLSTVLGGSAPLALVGRTHNAHLFMALDIEAFVDRQRYLQQMDVFLQLLRSTEPAVGHDRVRYPGLRAGQCERARLKQGIPLHPEVLSWYDHMASLYGLSAPWQNRATSASS